MARDYPEIVRWHELRGLVAPAPEVLPMTGVIELGVAAAFLYLTDSSVAFLDSMISNPRAPIRERSRAITALSEALFEEARERGYGTVLVTTRRRGIERRARALGYARVGDFVMMARSTATKHAEPVTLSSAGEV